MSWPMRLFKGSAILAVVASPLLSPVVALFGSVFVWTPVYIFLAACALFHNSAADLPWMVTDQTANPWIAVLGMAIVGFLLLRGIGMMVMVGFWTPIFLLSSYMVFIGLAVNHPGGWTGYVYDNYQDTTCELTGDWGHCVHVPLPGKHLPTFIDTIKGKIKEVIPYAASSRSAIPDVSTIVTQSAAEQAFNDAIAESITVATLNQKAANTQAALADRATRMNCSSMFVKKTDGSLVETKTCR